MCHKAVPTIARTMPGLVQSNAPRAEQGRSAAPLRPLARGELALAEVLASLGRTRCTVYARSLSDHVLQIYTGLYLLHAAGFIELRQRFGARPLRDRLGPPALDARFAAADLNGLFVDIEGAGLVFFDVRDGGDCYGELAGRVALYAKRSYRPGAYPGAEKFLPMGLNYAVHPDRTFWHELARSFRQLEPSGLAAKRLALSA